MVGGWKRPMVYATFIVIPIEKAMDSETGTAILVVSTTILHAWIVYVSFYWISNNCECV